MSQVKNYMELVVEELLKEILAAPHSQQVQHSPEFVAQVMAEALNHIRPFYVTRKEGEVYGYSAAAVSQNKADIVVEITKALAVVSEKGYT
ncbi:MAG: late competence development ComFB family protein [Angelakisella sp.]